MYTFLCGYRFSVFLGSCLGRKEIARTYGDSMFSFSSNWLPRTTFPPVMHASSGFSVSSTTLVACEFLVHFLFNPEKHWCADHSCFKLSGHGLQEVLVSSSPQTAVHSSHCSLCWPMLPLIPITGVLSRFTPKIFSSGFSSIPSCHVGHHGCEMTCLYRPSCATGFLFLDDTVTLPSLPLSTSQIPPAQDCCCFLFPSLSVIKEVPGSAGFPLRCLQNILGPPPLFRSLSSLRDETCCFICEGQLAF